VDHHLNFIERFESDPPPPSLFVGPQFDHYDPVKIKSHPGVFTEYFLDDLAKVLVTDFFGGVSRAEGVDEVDVDTSSSTSVRVNGEDASDIDGQSKVIRIRKRLPTRQGYMMKPSKRATDWAVDIAQGWTRWVALSGLIGLGGFAWMASC
jgi:glycosylphosphatidylinositol transamidase (GPIT) subunit GPI8